MSNLSVKKTNQTAIKSEVVRIDNEVKDRGEDKGGQGGKEGDKGGDRMEGRKKEEGGGDKKEGGGQDESVGTVSEMIGSAVATPALVVATKDPLTLKIETILEADLTDLYLAMNPKDQKVFKKKGEETLSKIRQLLEKTTVSAKKIFRLIAEWLKVIPGINRFFLEQEAKIKTDRILFMKEHEE